MIGRPLRGSIISIQAMSSKSVKVVGYKTPSSSLTVLRYNLSEGKGIIKVAPLIVVKTTTFYSLTPQLSRSAVRIAKCSSKLSLPRVPGVFRRVWRILSDPLYNRIHCYMSKARDRNQQGK